MKEIENRRSIRKYKDEPVDEKIIQQLIKSAVLAPSGDNTQPWHFIIIDDEEVKARVINVSHKQKWMSSAPLLIVCVADIRCRLKGVDDIYLVEETEAFELKQIIRDTAISVEYIVLEAVNAGLGTCWVAWFKQEEIRPVLNIPDDKFVVGVLTVGYPDESPKPRPRKDIKSMVHRNEW